MNQTAMHNVGGADSLGAIAVSDSLGSLTAGGNMLVTTAAEVPSAWMEIPVAEMFGAQSHPIDGVAHFVASQTLVGDTLFQAMTVLLFVVVLFFTARNMHQIVTMFGRILKGRLPEDLAAGRRDDILTPRFLRASATLGALFVTLFVAKYALVWLPESLTPPEEWLSAVAILLALAALAAIGIFEHALLWLIGKVTRNDEAVGSILYIKQACFAFATVAMSPIFMLGVLSSEKLTDVWNIILIVECAILLFLFMKETLAFFIDKKIPIFHWILYLCTVEAFPLSLIWALTLRS